MRTRSHASDTATADRPTNAATWGEPIHLPGYHHWVECVNFSPDSGLLVTAGGTQRSGGEVKLWE